MPTAQPRATRIAILCASAFAIANAVFYVLSGSYFASHREIIGGTLVATYTPDLMTQVRVTFATSAAIVAAVAFVASLWPRLIGHLLPAVFGAAYLAAGGWSFLESGPPVITATLLVAGALLPVLAWSSHRGSRPSWAFLVAICGVFAVIEFFGATRVRDALDIGFWTALILPPGLHIIAVVALVALRGGYVERGPARA